MEFQALYVPLNSHLEQTRCCRTLVYRPFMAPSVRLALHQSYETPAKTGFADLLPFLALSHGLLAVLS